MRVFLVDGQAKVRSALRLMFTMQPDSDVVGETAQAQDLLAQVQQTRPDVVLLDWDSIGASSNGLLSALRASSPRLKVIALSGRPEVRRASLAAGVDAFVSKSDPPDRLLEALYTVVPDQALKNDSAVKGASSA